MLRAIFNRAEFVEALELVGAVIPKRMPKTVLECVKLEATGKGFVRIAGRDLETAITVDFHSVEIEQTGIALLNLQNLLSSLKASTADIVKLEPRKDESGLVWRLADSDCESTIAAAKQEEFPPLPGCVGKEPLAGSFTVNRDRLVKGISHVVWSAGVSGAPGRWRFDSLCCSVRKGRVQLAATDSRTLAVADLGGLGEGNFGMKALEGDAEFVLPVRITKLLTAAAKYAADDADDFTASFSIETCGTDAKKYDSLTARFAIATVSVYCVVPDTNERQFPPYRDIMAGIDDRIRFTVSSEDFLSAVKKCSVALDQDSSGIVLDLDASYGARLSAGSYDGRTSRVNFPCKVIGGGVRVGLRPDQLTAAIKGAKSDEFTLAGSAANRPWIVRNGNGYRAVIMPVNVQEQDVPAPTKPATTEAPPKVPQPAPADTPQPSVPAVRSDVAAVQPVPVDQPSATSQPITVAWGALGHDVTQAASSAEAIRLAGLDWKVGQYPVSAIGPDGGSIVAKHFLANVREDTKAVLGMVGKKYRPFQNVEAFAFADAVVGEGVGAKYETAGALRDGRRVWMLLKLPSEVRAGPNDLIKPYLLIFNSFDGSSCLRALLTTIRVICHNSLNLALAAGRGEGITIRHRGDLQGRVADAHHTLGLVHQRLEAFTKEVELMRSVQIRSKTVLRYFDDLLPAVGAEATERERNNRVRALDRLQANFSSNLNTLSGMRGSVWAALNSATEWADHQRIFRGTTDLARRESRLDSIWFGVSSEFKTLAYEKALALAQRN
jgi:phage/plasmid-like protein (TIGR03299 family)